jgi:hypothetical protein
MIDLDLKDFEYSQEILNKVLHKTLNKINDIFQALTQRYFGRVLAIISISQYRAPGAAVLVTADPPCDDKPDIPACHVRPRPDGGPPCDEKPDLPAYRAKL